MKHLCRLLAWLASHLYPAAYFHWDRSVSAAPLVITAIVAPLEVMMSACNVNVSTRLSGKSLDWSSPVRKLRFLRWGSTVSENSAEATRKSDRPAVGHDKPLVSRKTVTGWASGNRALQFPPLCFRILDEQRFSAEKTYLKVVIGFYVIDGISSPKRGESEPVHYLSRPEDYKPVTGRLRIHVSPANETCDTDKFAWSFNDEYAGQPRTSALHLYRRNKHVHVQGEQDHRRSALSDDVLPRAMKRECYCFRGDCQSEAAVTA